MDYFKYGSLRRFPLEFNGDDNCAGLLEGKYEVILALKLLMTVDLKLRFNRNKSANMSSLSKSNSDSVISTKS